MKGTARPAAQDVLDYLSGRRSELVMLLRRMTEAESPSTRPETQSHIREVIAGALASLDYRVRRIPGGHSGGMLYARPNRRRRIRPAQLMLGHYDTVWPTGTLESMPFRVEGEFIRGPGVYDMKGGIAQALLALEALRHFDVMPAVTPLLFLNSDEEIGSPDSTRHIRRLARNVDRALVLEPSLGATGLLKTARKGIGKFVITVHGEAAHAGLDPGGGASAILELSHVIQALFALNDLERGVSVNVGTIDGGLRPNVIAPISTAEVDVRVPTREEARRIEQAIRAITPATPRTRLEFSGGFGRPAMERTPANRRLSGLALRLGRELGLALEEGTAGGGSDGNTTSQYTATLDGLGAVGDGAHAPHEHLHIGRTLERAALLTVLLMAEPLSTNPDPGSHHAH